jgi:imidazoleglycerol-phosphate dehydratase
MGAERKAAVSRETKETKIDTTLNIDGSGVYTVHTPIPFFTHLLELFAKHGRFDLELSAEGDIEVDYHHLVEDTGIILGEAFRKALGEKRGIRRYATVHLPMDEALARVCVDLSGRAFLSYQVEVQEPLVLHFNIQLAEEFFRAFSHNAEITLHVDLIRGRNAHHVVEALFKALGVALGEASEIRDPGGDVPSTKGTLTS